MLLRGEKFFQPIKNLRFFLVFRATAGPQRRSEHIETNFIQLKVSILRPKIMPKQLLNISKTTFKNPRKRLFWPWKWSKWPSQRAKFWPKILILEVIYRPFELKIQLKVGILRPKIMPKQLLNISKTTFKKSKKRLFWPPKWSNHGYQFCRFWQKCRFLGVFWP